MFNILVKTFIKDSENIKDTKVRENYGKFAGLVGIISNFILFVLKFTLGTIFKSVSVVADSINNLADSVSSLVTLVGFKLAGKPADKEHPYGHARIEYIAGVIVSFLVILIGWQLILTSFDKIFSPEETEFGTIIFIGLFLSIIIKFWQGMFYKFVGKKINSSTVSANSADSFNDVISTAVVLIGAVISFFTSLNLDGYLGLLVALFIVYSGIKLVIETCKPLLGEAPNNKMVHEIRSKVLAYEGVLGVHDLMVHSYGAGKLFASLHCEVKSSADMMESHDLIDNIEKDFLDTMGIQMVIHLDPVDTDNEKTNGLREKLKFLINEKYENSSMHDFRVVWGIDHSNLVFDVCIPFSQEDSDEKVIANIEKIVHEIDEKFRLKVTVDRVPL